MWHHSRSEVKEGGDEDETANRCTHTAQRVPASTENEKENMELHERIKVSISSIKCCKL